MVHRLLSNGHLVPLFQGLPVGWNILFFSSQVIWKQRFVLWTWKPEKCVCCSSLPGPWILSTEPSPSRLLCHIEGPWAGDPLGLFCSRTFLKQISLTRPLSPASMDTSFGFKHIKSQGTAANNGGPETKCHWDEDLQGQARAQPSGAEMTPGSWIQSSKWVATQH